MKYFFIFLFILIITIIFITFGAQNNQFIHINYLISQRDYRVSTLLVTIFSIGFFIGWITFSLCYLRPYISLCRAEKKFKKLIKSKKNF
ncbi:Lipopolysaccharide assembly protein A [Candidatus Ecksteinia adelgidicola]|nr:Lipopolysaccharide assembly protein A [Candidatus Ecksteinia adelgidicola]